MKWKGMFFPFSSPEGDEDILFLIITVLFERR
jgi:hypothetical protein